MRLIPLLEQAQANHGYLSEAVLRDLAHKANVPLHRLQELVSFYPHFRTMPPPRVELLVCRDVSCWLAGSEACFAKLKELHGNGVEVKEVSCLGRCDRAPAGMRNGEPVELRDPANVTTWVADPPRTWRLDPYPTLAERYGIVRSEPEPEAVIAALKDSGLRGMGGAGFPTGTKWEFVRKEARTPKYVICNADESEPGTFKDAALLRDAPHLILEGMMLAGRTVGAERGIVFLRHEYQCERQRLEAALREAPTDFPLEIFVSPGGYILGEETALLEALEDRRGEPRNKPPFPGSHGLYGLPTLINNVETFANVPFIVKHGAAAWQALRPKLFAVSGHVERPGVYEVSLGTTVRELIELAGGVSGGRKLLAFAPGGASSNFLPANMVDVRLDFAELANAGSMLGSGALIVVAEGTDLLALATNVTRFFRNESCGKCVPCRVGSQKAVELLESRQSLELLPDLGEAMALTSICGLGQVAVAPALSILKHWPEVAK